MKKLSFTSVLAIVAMAGFFVCAYADEVSFPEGECFADSLKDGAFNPDYKALEFKNVNGLKTACIDAMSRVRTQTLEFPEGVTVEAVEYNREFPVNKASTVMFPFDFFVNCLKTTSNFYKAIRLVDYNKDGAFTLDFGSINEKDTEGGIIQANHPYLILKLNSAGALSFEVDSCYDERFKTVTFVKNSAADNIVNLDNWEFRGTYSYYQWKEGDPDLGRIYGFAAKAQSENSVGVGDFVRVSAGASILPMRAYLRYNNTSRENAENKPEFKPAEDGSSVVSNESSVGSVVNLPQYITVRIINDKDLDENEGGTTVIGRMDTRTGVIEMRDNLWFDLKGRVYDRKPNIKGTYYNNGNKVIIK